jgi:hypothetical protein
MIMACMRNVAVMHARKDRMSPKVKLNILAARRLHLSMGFNLGGCGKPLRQMSSCEA